MPKYIHRATLRKDKTIGVESFEIIGRVDDHTNILVDGSPVAYWVEVQKIWRCKNEV